MPVGNLILASNSGGGAKYTITVVSADTSKGTVSGTTTFEYKTKRAVQTVAITTTTNPVTGYEFDNYTTSLGSIASGILTIPADTVGDIVVTANWKNATYNVTVTSNDTSKGTVSGTTSFTYTYNTAAQTLNITTVATKVIGNKFDGFVPSVGSMTGGTTLNIPAGNTGDISVVATFSVEYFAITVASNDPSKGTISGTTSYQYQESNSPQTITLNVTATPTSGNEFDEYVTSAGTVTGTVSGGSLTIPANTREDIEVTVKFKAEGGTIKATLTDGIAGTVMTGVTVTATKGTDVKTAVTDASGIATISGLADGTWAVTSTLQTGYVVATTENVAVTVGTESTCAIKQYQVSTTLGDNPWAVISAVAKSGNASTVWSVGAYKDDTINGTVGAASLSGTYRFYITDFDHNSAKEGANTISFMVKTTGGVDIAFIDSKYGSSVSTTGYFSMNSSNTNVGGWASSQMKANICPAFLNALSADLKAVVADSKIYSDNTGGGSSSASKVTSTIDKIYLAAEYEVQGARTYANTAEQSNQTQFSYYSGGASKVRYQHSSTSSAAFWWCRSVYAGDSHRFCSVSTDGSASGSYAYGSRGFAPCFKIGQNAA